jgi:hypothetical protein
MELLPKGANFVRAKTLWEIGLHLAGNPATPYGGNRDMVITIGSGSSAAFRPWLRLATGSAILAEQVAKGDGVELAFVNPSALLTQAYRGGRPVRRATSRAHYCGLSELGPLRVHDPPANGDPLARRHQGETLSAAPLGA